MDSPTGKHGDISEQERESADPDHISDGCYSLRQTAYFKGGMMKMEIKEWKGFCDLHLHTTNSDGKYTPYELARLCMDKGIQTIAFTDHNVMLPQKEMNALRGKFPEMHLIDGSEISAAHQLLSGKMKEIQ